MAIVIPKNELNEFSLPRVCCVTGQTGPVTFQKVQFQWIPKWIAIFAMAPLIYLVFYMLMRKTASGTMPFSEQAWNDLKVARRNMAIAVIGLIVAIMGSAAVAANTRGDVGPLLMLVSIIAGVIAIIVVAAKMQKLYPRATLVDDRAVTLTLPSPVAEDLFNRHLNAGARPAA
ncbi:MAG TPA: hypothetical protein VGD87_11540 [Archangium sp.]